MFFCVLIRKVHYDLLGGIAGVFGLGNYEDDDFCLRARLAGLKLAIDPGAYVFHYGSRTFAEQKIDHVQWMLKNEQIYYERLARLGSQTVFPRLAWHTHPDTVNISVIVRTKDRPYALQRALTSLANQTLRNFEIVLINDGGLDPTPILASYQHCLKVNLINHRTPVGRAAALNAGLQAARGQWIGYLDDDDILYPYHLDLLYTAATRHGSPCVVYSEANKALAWSDEIQRELIILARNRFAMPRDFSLGELMIDNWILYHELSTSGWGD